MSRFFIDCRSQINLATQGLWVMKINIGFKSLKAHLDNYHRSLSFQRKNIHLYSYVLYIAEIGTWSIFGPKLDQKWPRFISHEISIKTACMKAWTDGTSSKLIQRANFSPFSRRLLWILTVISRGVLKGVNNVYKSQLFCYDLRILEKVCESNYSSNESLDASNY